MTKARKDMSPAELEEARARDRLRYHRDPKRRKASHRWQELNPELARAAKRRWEDRNREKVNAQARARTTDPERREEYLERRRRWYAAHREKVMEEARRRREENPDAYHARTRLNVAVRFRQIEKLPCEVCGDVKSEGHHEDYSRPLDVRWLCRKHHAELHRLEKAA